MELTRLTSAANNDPTRVTTTRTGVGIWIMYMSLLRDIMHILDADVAIIPRNNEKTLMLLKLNFSPILSFMRIIEYDIVAKRITNYKFDSYNGATMCRNNNIIISGDNIIV